MKLLIIIVIVVIGILVYRELKRPEVVMRSTPQPQQSSTQVSTSVSIDSLRDWYTAEKEKSEQANKERIAKDNVRQNLEAKSIVAFLESRGATDIWTNGYSFHFNLNGKYVSFVNQTDRLCCDWWVEPDNDLDREMLFQARLYRNMEPNKWQSVLKHFKYGSMIINGNPTDCIKELVAEIEATP